MSDGPGCSNILGVVGFAIGAFLLYNNVQPVVIEEKVPPPQESWSYVYPQFRDDVSSQLFNTQELVGVAIEDAEYIQKQNTKLQYSVDILLNELGLAQEKYAEESRKQRLEQWFQTGLGILLGWIISTVLPPERVTDAVSKMFGKQTPGPNTGAALEVAAVQTTNGHISIQEFNRTDPVARMLARIFVIAAITLVVLLLVYFIGI